MTTATDLGHRLNNVLTTVLDDEGDENVAAWESPIPLDPITGPPFPIHALPGMVGDMVNAVAEETQTPPDLPALVTLGTLSAAAGGKYVAYVPTSNYTEPIHGMFVSVADPGNRKSAVFRLITAPIGEWEREQQEREAPAIAQWESRLRVLEKELAIAESEQGKPARDGNLTVGDAQRMAAVDALEEHRKKRPILTEIFTDDATPESVKATLIAQRGALAVMSAESAYLSNVAGRYSNAPHLDTILNGHAGDEIKVSRKGKTTERTERACLTLCLMVQPQVIESLGQIEGFRDRGAAARLLAAFPADLIGTRQTMTTPVPGHLAASWRDLLRTVLDTERSDNPRVLHLDTEALTVYDAYRGELEPSLKSEGRYMQGWLAKLAGAVLRIAGLLHIAQYERPETARISAATIESAICIGTYFHQHARIMFRLMYGRNGQNEAGAILEVLRSVDASSITKRDLYQRVRDRSAFQTVDSLNEALSTLEEYGWIRREKQTTPKGGRPSETIFLHPVLGTQNPQNPLSVTTAQGFEGFEGVLREKPVPNNITPTAPNPLDSPSTDEHWRVEI